MILRVGGVEVCEVGRAIVAEHIENQSQSRSMYPYEVYLGRRTKSPPGPSSFEVLLYIRTEYECQLLYSTIHTCTISSKELLSYVMVNGNFRGSERPNISNPRRYNVTVQFWKNSQSYGKVQNLTASSVWPLPLHRV